MFKRILVVCIGNICRSPVAEALLKNHFSTNNINIAVTSAGIGAMVGNPADEHVQALMQTRAIDLKMHRAQQLTTTMVLEADLILVMEIFHKQQILRKYPHANGKVFLLGHWGSFEVPDPYRRKLSDYEHAVKLIETGVADWQRKIGVL